MPWQLPPTRALAYADWETIANTTERVLGRGRDSFGARPLSWYRQQVFNESARDWCLPYEGPEACDFDWVDKQPCCTACGEDQPPRPGSNLCLNDTRLPPEKDNPSRSFSTIRMCRHRVTQSGPVPLWIKRKAPRYAP